ncbi:MAG: flavodoxin family protein, partial [Coriobacteriales bacterium]
MKVVLVNGSPRPNGCTFTALTEVAGALKKNGIETQIFQVGKKPVAGCLECGACSNTKMCVIEDVVRDFAEVAETADGFVFGSPVYYASINGQMSAFLDRVFYSGIIDGAGKPGAAVVSCRRGGASAAFDQMNKYFGISGMITVGSQYWNSVHGNTPDEVRRDLEGMQTMRTLGNNMAWILKCIEAGKKEGIFYPGLTEPKEFTNFIR